MVLSDTSNGKLGWKKWLMTVWAFMECLLFSGIVYGWASLSFVLKMEGIYSDLCEDEMKANETKLTPSFTFATTLNASSTHTPKPNYEYQKPCKPQDEKFALCITITGALMGTGSAVVGFINYKFGTRITRFLLFVVFEFGTLLMAFVSKDTPWLIFPGLAFISIGGLLVIITNIQVAYLFTVGSSTVVSLFNGAYDSSSIVMLLVKIAHQHGFARQNMFISIAVIHVIVLISTVFFLPKHFIVSVSSETYESTASTKQNTSSNNRGALPKQDIPTLKGCLSHSKYITCVFWMIILNLRLQYFLGTLNQYLTRLLHTEDQVSYFTDVCYYTMLSSIVGSFLTGALYDWQKRRYKDGKSPLFRELMPSILPMAMTSLIATLMSILILIPVKELLYAVFIVMTMYRAFLYSLGAAYIRNTFPSQYFGFLFGTMHFLAAIFGFLQYAIYKWSAAYVDGDFHADIFLLCLSILSFAHPLYWLIACYKDENRFETQPCNTENMELSCVVPPDNSN